MSYSQDELQEIFRDFDRDKSGTISGGELREVLRRLDTAKMNVKILLR